MWDDSIPLQDTVSVIVRRSDIMKVRALYEELAEGDLEIAEDFDPGEPTPDDEGRQVQGFVDSVHDRP
jgi:hypothetical protein